MRVRNPYTSAWLEKDQLRRRSLSGHRAPANHRSDSCHVLIVSSHPSPHTHIQTHRQTDGRTDRQTDRQTERDNCINSGTSRPASLHFRRLTPGQLRGTRSDDTSDMFGLLHPRIIIIIIIIMTAGPGCCCRHTHLCSLYIS